MAERWVYTPAAHGIRRSGRKPLLTSPMRWAGALGVIALVATCAGPSSSPYSSPTVSVMTSPPSPAPTEAAGFSELEVGEAAELECGSTPPVFSVSGSLLACDQQLRTWPAMSSEAELTGMPLGWGQLEGSESLLLEVGPGRFTIVGASGAQRVVDTDGLEGRIVATWSPGGDAIWLQSGLQTPALRLDSWTLSGRKEHLSVPNDVGATNITASANRGWAAIWGSGCSPAGCGLTVAVFEAASSTTTPVANGLAGVLANVWVADRGDVLFAVAGDSGLVDLWRASPGETARLWVADAAIWPLVGSRLAVAAPDGAFVFDLISGGESALRLPPGTEAADLLSVSPASDWVALRSARSSVLFAPRTDAESIIEIPLSSLSGVSVLWAGHDYAALFTGPPPETIVVALRE